ncbi:hypothetical protein WICPIJ_009563 [Wickerhamomyces pijperi]|uniref:F-box domain-containing protein n=1 Tax=Wickerhamomyces pijperi TaxID=599730 RepID=A0A9P8PN07_WICPI|nr:hypothetical protein WICPIJ_009563 [Wickerhamomyces pijperi]
MNSILGNLPNDVWLDIFKLLPFPTVQTYLNISIIKPQLFHLVVHHHNDNQLKYFSPVLVNSSLNRYHVKARGKKVKEFVTVHEFTYKEYWEEFGSEFIRNGGLKRVDCFVDDLDNYANPSDILKLFMEDSTNSDQTDAKADEVEVLVFHSSSTLTGLKTVTDKLIPLFPNTYTFRNLRTLDYSLGQSDVSDPKNIEYVSNLQDLRDLYPSLEVLQISSYISVSITSISLASVRVLSLEIHCLKEFRDVSLPNLELLKLYQKFYVALSNNPELATKEGRKAATDLNLERLLSLSDTEIDQRSVDFPKLKHFEAQITDVHFLVKYPFIIRFLQMFINSPNLQSINLPVKIAKGYYSWRTQDQNLVISLLSNFKLALTTLMESMQENRNITEFSNKSRFDNWSSDHLFSDASFVGSLHLFKRLKKLALSNVTLSETVRLDIPSLKELDLTYSLESNFLIVTSESLKKLTISIKSTKNKLIDLSKKTDLTETFPKISSAAPNVSSLALNFLYVTDLLDQKIDRHVYQNTPFKKHHSELLNFKFDQPTFTNVKSLRVTGSIFEIHRLVSWVGQVDLPKLETFQLTSSMVSILNQSLLRTMKNEMNSSQTVTLNTPLIREISVMLSRPKFTKRSNLESDASVLQNPLFNFSILNPVNDKVTYKLNSDLGTVEDSKGLLEASWLD